MLENITLGTIVGINILMLGCTILLLLVYVFKKSHKHYSVWLTVIITGMLVFTVFGGYFPGLDKYGIMNQEAYDNETDHSGHDHSLRPHGEDGYMPGDEHGAGKALDITSTGENIEKLGHWDYDYIVEYQNNHDHSGHDHGEGEHVDEKYNIDEKIEISKTEIEAQSELHDQQHEDGKISIHGGEHNDDYNTNNIEENDHNH